MNVSEQLVENILQVQFESLGKEVVESAKSRIIDTVGALIGGANAPGCSVVVNLVREWGGKAESTILVHGGKVPAHNAAMVNSIMARSYDFESCGPFVDGKRLPGHISGTTVPTAIAVAEQRGASGKELIVALVVGDDVASRVLAASDYSFDLGWDCTGTVNMFGATAIAGRLWELDERQLLNAFGIVLNQLGGTFQTIYDGTHCFKLPQGLASRAGILSIELASRGFTGVKDFLMSGNGYFAQYCQIYHPEVVTKGLGKKFYADAIFKLYPCCRSIHAALDCVLELVRQNDIKPEDIDKVTVEVRPGTRAWDMFIGQPFEIGDDPEVNAAFNLPYNLANALLRKGVRLEHFTEEFIRDPKVIQLAERVRVTTTLPPEKALAAKVTINMKNGRVLSAATDTAKGDSIESPLTREELKEKFRNNMAFSKTIRKGNAEEALNMLENLEEVKNVAEIVKELVKKSYKEVKQ